MSKLNALHRKIHKLKKKHTVLVDKLNNNKSIDLIFFREICVK